MRLKELKCKNCGATIKVEENAAQAKCEFCHTTFAVEDAFTDGYKYEKGRLKAHDEQLEKNLERAKGIIAPIGKVVAVQYIVSAVVGLVIFVIIAISVFSMIFSFNDKGTTSNDGDIINDMDVIMSKAEIKSFNWDFEMYQGTEYGSSVGRLLDTAITNNKKNSSIQVTVEYKDVSTKDPEEIKNLKKQFDEWTKYEVSFEYNNTGLIYLIKIED